MYNSRPEQISVRINYRENIPQIQKYRGKVYTINLDTFSLSSIAALAVYISKEIGLESDTSIFENDRAKLYSQDGVELNDHDLYFLESYGILYLDIYGYPFSYQQILHQYKINEKLGEGDYGVVYKITDKISGIQHAMKMVKVNSFFNKANTAENLFREQKALMKLNYMHIVKMHNSFIVKDKICQIMELCAGGELKQYLAEKPHRRVSEKEARYLILQILRGISYCHQQGIIHRNIKPENLLIKDPLQDKLDKNTKGNSFFMECLDINQEEYEKVLLKIGDFSIAGINKSKMNCASMMTNVLYQPPEVLAGLEIDIQRAIDVWACGIILYQMLYGYHPFLDDHCECSIDNIIEGELKFSKVIPVTPECKNLISMLLEKDPKKRSTVFSVFSHPWVDLTDKDLDDFAHNFHNKNNVKVTEAKLTKEKSFAVHINGLNHTPMLKDDFFDYSVKQIPFVGPLKDTPLSPQMTRSPTRSMIKKFKQRRHESYNFAQGNIVKIFMNKNKGKRSFVGQRQSVMLPTSVTRKPSERWFSKRRKSKLNKVISALKNNLSQTRPDSSDDTLSEIGERKQESNPISSPSNFESRFEKFRERVRKDFNVQNIKEMNFTNCSLLSKKSTKMIPGTAIKINRGRTRGMLLPTHLNFKSF